VGNATIPFTGGTASLDLKATAEPSGNATVSVTTASVLLKDGLDPSADYGSQVPPLPASLRCRLYDKRLRPSRPSRTRTPLDSTASKSLGLRVWLSGVRSKSCTSRDEKTCTPFYVPDAAVVVFLAGPPQEEVKQGRARLLCHHSFQRRLTLNQLAGTSPRVRTAGGETRSTANAKGSRAATMSTRSAEPFAEKHGAPSHKRANMNGIRRRLGASQRSMARTRTADAPWPKVKKWPSRPALTKTGVKPPRCQQRPCDDQHATRSARSNVARASAEEVLIKPKRGTTLFRVRRLHSIPVNSCGQFSGRSPGSSAATSSKRFVADQGKEKVLEGLNASPVMRFACGASDFALAGSALGEISGKRRQNEHL